MTLRITFDLSDQDLKHFKLIMREARSAAAQLDQSEIIDAARGLLKDSDGQDTAGFVGQRLEKLRTMIAMIEDEEWNLPKSDSTRVLNALAYFTEPEDLIPDHIPSLGFLDDAIMIELVVRELRHEIQAYEDFCDYRGTEKKKRKKTDDDIEVTRESWLKTRRQELQSRMRRRRRGDRDKRKNAKGRKSPFSLW